MNVKKSRIPICGHPEAEHAALGLCRRCYRSELYQRDTNRVKQQGIAWRAANTQKHRETRAAWNEANPGSNRRYHLEKHFGLSVSEYDRILKAQNGVCAICGQCETVKDKKGRIRPLAVDHDRSVGRHAVRELLCHSCNTAVGHLDEDSTRIRRAADYVDKWHAVYRAKAAE